MILGLKKEFQKDDLVKKPKFDEKNVKKKLEPILVNLPTYYRNNQTIRKVKK
jgi:hypothetical protein